MLFEKPNISITRTDTIHCAPLPVYVEAVGIRFIDFFSLDVEGAEEFVVETMPLRRSLGFHVVMIESWNRMCRKECEKREGVRRRMLAMGFNLYPNMVRNSDVFVNATLPQPDCAVGMKNGQKFTKNIIECNQTRFAPVMSANENDHICKTWNCTCQGYSDIFDTFQFHWGKAMSQSDYVKAWWMDHKCATIPNSQRSQG
jgi:hypothetical protein